MYALRKCHIRHLCYYANICNRVALTTDRCKLDQNRSTCQTTEPIDFKAYDDKETAYDRQQAWIYESYGVSDGGETQ